MTSKPSEKVQDTKRTEGSAQVSSVKKSSSHLNSPDKESQPVKVVRLNQPNFMVTNSGT